MTVQITVPGTIIKEVLGIGGGGTGRVGITQTSINQRFHDRLRALIPASWTTRPSHHKGPQRSPGPQRSDLQGNPDGSIRLIRSGQREFHQSFLLIDCQRMESSADPDHPGICRQSFRKRSDAGPKRLIITGFQNTELAIREGDNQSRMTGCPCECQAIHQRPKAIGVAHQQDISCLRRINRGWVT